MLYTLASSHQYADGVRLFLRLEDAQAAADGGQRIRAVAAHYDGLLNRLIPLLASGRSSPIPAESLRDGSVIARGSIPEWLFLEANLPAGLKG